MQRCSCPLAKLGCIQNDGALDLACAATRPIHCACKYRAGAKQVARMDDMLDVVSSEWDWNELRDSYRLGDKLPAAIFKQGKL
jgi:hypothetical protein